MAKNNTQLKKRAKNGIEVNGNLKVPKESENAESYLSKNPVWRFNRCDKDHGKWSVHGNCDFYGYLMKKLIDFEGMTWNDIRQATGGKSKGTNNHFIPVYELTKEAQSRLDELNIYYDSIYSLRLSGKERLFGILEDGIFNILWHDPNHEICPSPKKNT